MSDETRAIDCDQQCEIPPGVRIADVPQPRHNWGDVVQCPNDGCERSFLVLGESSGSSTGGTT